VINQDHLTVLRKGVDSWNAWRQVHLEPDLSGIELEGQDFDGIDFSGANLQNAKLNNCSFARANFTGARCTDASFRGCTLSEANLTDAVLEGASFNGANLSGAVLDAADAKGANFSAAFLSEISFKKTQLENATFVGATLHRAVFKRAEASYAKFDRADLSDADLSNARLRGCGFFATDLSNANLCEADLSEATAIAVTVNETTDLTGATVNRLRIEKHSLEALRDHGGLTISDRFLMDIVDAAATLKFSYGGSARYLHLFALVMFIFPYVWFIFKYRTLAGVVGSAEEAGVASPDYITMAEGLLRYVKTGGASIQDGAAANIFSIFTTLYCLTYNVVRMVFISKTRQLELEQEIRGASARFSLIGGWGQLYRFAKIGVAVYVVLWLWHTWQYIFIQRIPVF